MTNEQLLAEKNAELQKELAAQKRELEIEAGLERVRAVAMGMKEPAGMLEICKTISQQLEALHVKEIRNVQTAIFYESKGTYMNYEYYAKHDKTFITETSFTNHEMHKLFAAQMLKGKGEFFTRFISKPELPDWIAYQKTTNVFIDDYLNTAASLNYYWFSLGPVALGISTYEPLQEEETILFKRFLKVFELSYTRYLDIEKAEAQAREAQIQLALERVRARTMAMQKSDELSETAFILFQQFRQLGEYPVQITIGIFNEEKKVIEFHVTGLDGDGSKVDESRNMDLNEPFLLNKLFIAWKEQSKSIIIKLAGDELIGWMKYRQSVAGDLGGSADFSSGQERFLGAAFFSKGLISFSKEKSISDETMQILKRFAQVFEQTYTRFLDLQKAEAQSREAQIELALERVRARTMAMHKSEELIEIMAVMFEQLVQLQFHTDAITLSLEYKANLLNLWMAIPGETYPAELRIPYISLPFVNRIMKAVRSGADFYSTTCGLEEKNRWINHLFEHTIVKYTPEERKLFLLQAPGIALSLALGKNIALLVANYAAIPFTTEENGIIKRFANVFEQSYTRFLDLQKAEAQAREAQIEAALEKVRSHSLAMHSSDELGKVVTVVIETLSELNLKMDGAIIAIYTEGSRYQLHWTIAPHLDIPAMCLRLPYFDNIIMKEYFNAKEEGLDFFQNHYSFEEKNSFFNYVYAYTDYMQIPDNVKDFCLKSESYAYSCAFGKNSGIMLLNFSGQLLSESEAEILKRFSRIFEQTYTRFLDLQKAEAQARESQIETSLERVRSRTMGMQKSDELKEVIQIVYEQFTHLKINLEHAGFVVDYTLKGDWHFWIADEQEIPSKITHPYFDSVWANQFNEAKEKGSDFFAINLNFEEKNKFYQELLSYVPDLPEESKNFYLSAPGVAISTVLFDNVSLYIENFSGISYTDDENKILMRFGKVFQQTYTRFLDLQKAEAQARESQIELSLERLRAKTMAMHNSADVGETAAIMVEELKKLGIETIRCGIGIMHVPGDMEVWTISTDDNNKTDIIIGWLDMNMHPLLHGAFESWRNKIEAYAYDLKDEDLLNYYNAINNYPGYPIKYDTSNLPKLIHHNEFHFAEGTLFAFSLQQLTDEQRKIFKRFAGVFGQTYRRYLDLKKAEAQAREAKIEAALERVRARAMAMHNSQDLADTIGVFYRELHSFSLTPRRCGVGLLDKKERIGELFTWNTTEQGQSLELVGTLKMNGHPVLNGVYEHWLSQQEYHPVLRGNEIKEYYKILRPQMAFPNYNHDDVLYGYFFFFTEGGVYAWTEKEMLEDELQIYRRFTSVLSLTYKRYKDLQLAEAQAKEAQIETALERVRSRTLAMQKSDELAETSAVLFKQLIGLGIEPNRLYISIIKDGEGNSEFWITDEDGSKVSTAYTANLNDNPSFKKMYEGWKQQQKSLVIDMHDEELQEYFKHLNTLNVPFKGGLVQKRRLQYIAYFSKGFIGMASPDEQPQETVELLNRFAYVFNLTFTRFNDLQIAEAHALQAEQDLIEIKAARKKAEDALTELQATQTQLIQSEKMASLGELTAGIAHEIQNPLNFVTNFSEVNQEMVNEATEEIEKGNYDEVKIILNDIKDNSEKINHHGKRADAIVKGMLQHSRKSTGQKEPTDINALCDEFLRLSYHGLRAKDKSFNADFKTDFDESIGKINIVPQNLGRVLLNLINNAFYAVAERRKAEGETYKGIVSVCTKRINAPLGNENVEIIVSDNGNGIPSNIIDKIFQPFFTTKPAGQGTGLGLSLAYDIITKEHNGTIKVESKEGEGTAFIIQLQV